MFLYIPNPPPMPPRVPNPFQKIKWKRIIAVPITRIDKCFEETDPLPYILLIVGFMFGLMFTTFPFLERENMPTILQGMWYFIKTFFWLIISLESFVYGIWEIVQGFKALSKWASRHTNE